MIPMARSKNMCGLFQGQLIAGWIHDVWSDYEKEDDDEDEPNNWTPLPCPLPFWKGRGNVFL
jgi:hypothetical protein